MSSGYSNNPNPAGLQVLQQKALTPAGVNCLLQDLTRLESTQTQGSHCGALWDGIYCWFSTPVGQNVSKACPDMRNASDFQEPINSRGDRVVTRFCLDNQTWYWDESTNYTVCLPFEEINEIETWSIQEIIRYTLFSGSVLSLLFLSVAILLFSRFKSIRCDRIVIHTHFMVALSIKSAILILISDPTPFSEKYYYRDVDWICKLVIIVQLYSFLASVNWMLIQGHFLNSKLSTDVFQTKHRLTYYSWFGWGAPLPIVLTWYAMMQMYHKVHCWRHYSKSNFAWIIAAPMFSALLANVVYLWNIIRILLGKARKASNASDIDQFRRASKATAILFPLLGINNLICFFNPGGSGQVYYMMTNAVVQPLQGILVSVLYCFICKDVRSCVRREYARFYAMRSIPTARYQSYQSNVSFTYRGNPEARSILGLKCCAAYDPSRSSGNL